MPFQLDGSRFDRPKVVDFARRRNLEKPLSLSLSLCFGCFLDSPFPPTNRIIVRSRDSRARDRRACMLKGFRERDPDFDGNRWNAMIYRGVSFS